MNARMRHETNWHIKDHGDTTHSLRVSINMAASLIIQSAETSPTLPDVLAAHPDPLTRQVAPILQLLCQPLRAHRCTILWKTVLS